MTLESEVLQELPQACVNWCPVPTTPVMPGAWAGTTQAVEQHEQLSLESKYPLKTSADCKTVLN